jgi:outer membrane protein OmpA-like peptidoglycan-associated protein
MANITITNNKAPFTIKTNENGDYIAELPLQMELSLLAQKENYFASAITSVSSMDIQKDSTVIINFVLDGIPTEGYEFTLQGIYYDVDKFIIRPDAAKVLDSLASILTVNPNITIELGSHTDSRAAEDYNLTLSQKRAQSCVDYLTKKGINKDRLTAVGYGETHLVNDCVEGVDCTEEQHQENRRTTFRVTSIEYKTKRK